jgi:Uma2 family endonuclease
MMEPTTSQEEQRTPPEATPSTLTGPLPDHLHLPETDGTFVKNFQEHPQSVLLTDSITPVMQRLHPDGQYCIGQDCGIYWRSPLPLEEPWRAAVSPDWFYVPNRPPLLDGRIRRSYVMWYEVVSPLLVIEFVSGDGSEERDRTPRTGKFWIYEQAVHAAYYAIYEVDPGRVEVYRLEANRYRQLSPNERGHYPIPPLGVELGIWQGQYQNVTLPWLRWWDNQGQLLLTGHEQVEQQRREKELAQQRADRLAAKLHELGHEPE